MSPDVTESHVGERLYKAGWRQGAILRSAPFKYAYNNKLAANNENVEMKSRTVKNKECLVIVSQDCDILSKSEPYMEAFICSKESSDFCARIIEGNSSRWFLIDQDNCLVAQATRRMLIKKELLEPFEPESWPSDNDHLDRFARWLARRYIRPAFSDEFVEAVQDPVGETVRNASEQIVGNFSRIVHEMRISKSSTQGPPFDVTVILLILRDDITEEEANAIEHLTEEIRTSLESDSRINDVEFPLRTLDEMSVAEYFATYPLYLEHHTHGGEDYMGGAEPLPQT